MQAITHFGNLPETKEQVTQYKELIKDSLRHGEQEPLKFISIVSALERLVKDLKGDEEVKAIVLDEAEKHGKSFEYGNAKFQVKEAGTKFDFSNCQDEIHEKLSIQMAELKNKLKDRETFLKTIKPDIEVFGGDGRRLEPAIKTSQTIVSVTLK